jgi:S-DNA-T family DNA segregation ATPase FtsK/SpoIIIE
VKIGNVNRAGYRRADLEAAVPEELLLAARQVEGVDPQPPSTGTPA